MSGKDVTYEVTKKGKEDKPKDAEEEIRKLKEQLEAETVKRQDYEEKLKMVADKEFERKKKEAGCTDDKIDAPFKLEGWIQGQGLSKAEKEKRKLLAGMSEAGGAGGQTPLSGNLYEPNKDWKELEYDNPKDFVAMLRERIEHGDSEAEDVLDKMLERAMKQGSGQSGKVVIGGTKELKVKRRKRAKNE